MREEKVFAIKFSSLYPLYVKKAESKDRSKDEADRVICWLTGYGPDGLVTGGIHEALDQARKAANGKDVRIGGGPHTIRQYLRAGLIDELHLAIAPVLLGAGERLFEDVDLRAFGYKCMQFVGSQKAAHVVLRKRSDVGRTSAQA
jgi:riboflavin biosynthesis pyrimidine reductase